MTDYRVSVSWAPVIVDRRHLLNLKELPMPEPNARYEAAHRIMDNAFLVASQTLPLMAPLIDGLAIEADEKETVAIEAALAVAALLIYTRKKVAAAEHHWGMPDEKEAVVAILSDLTHAAHDAALALQRKMVVA